jgi:hypothetical protein
MSPEEKAAFVMARSASMLCKLEGMKVRNEQREKLGLPHIYEDVHFEQLPVEFGCDWNSLIEIFNQGGDPR